MEPCIPHVRERRLAKGATGTGKTRLLLDRARALASLGVGPEDVLARFDRPASPDFCS